MTSKLQNSNHITNTCDTVWLMIEFACENVQNWHHDKFMGPLLNFRTCKLKNEQTVFSLAYIQPKNTVYRTSHPIYCLRKLILDRWGPYDENFDLVCSSFLTLFTKQRLPFWFSCKHESVADHMTWLIYQSTNENLSYKAILQCFCKDGADWNSTLLQPENVSQIWQTFMFCCQICCRPPKMEDFLHKWIKLHGFVQYGRHLTKVNVVSHIWLIVNQCSQLWRLSFTNRSPAWTWSCPLLVSCISEWVDRFSSAFPHNWAVSGKVWVWLLYAERFLEPWYPSSLLDSILCLRTRDVVLLMPWTVPGRSVRLNVKLFFLWVP